jgi:hypothetical protein
MKRIVLSLFLAAALAPASAQAARKMEDSSIAVLRMIDKLSARTSTFEVPVEKTVKFGSRLFIKVRACRKTSPLDSPENAAFLQIWEKPPGTDESKWVFSGWMFSSRPSASAMDNPVYDVWLIDCKSAATAAAPLTTEAAPDTGAMKNAPVSAPDADKSKSAPDTGASKSSEPGAQKNAPATDKPAPEKPAPDSGAPPEDSEAAPDEDDKTAAPDPAAKIILPAPVVKPSVPAGTAKTGTPDSGVTTNAPETGVKTNTPEPGAKTQPLPTAKVFDPAAIRRDLEENAGGGVSDGEDAVSGPDGDAVAPKKDGKKN